MACWHSLSGYLTFKSSLGIWSTRRRYWCLLDEQKCALVYYKDEEEAGYKLPLGEINIKTSTVLLSLDQNNQFIISCDGKDHYLTADNHESMMIWLLALQAKRDLCARKEITFAPKPYFVGKTHRLSSRPSFIHQQYKSQATHTVLPRSQSLSEQRSQRLSMDARGKIISRLGKSMDSSEGWLSSFGGLHDSIKERQTSEDENDIVFIPASNGVNRSASPDIHDDLLDASFYSSLSRYSASSDSAIDTLDSQSNRMADLEKQLLHAKGELEKATRRETAYQDAMKKRDHLIMTLDEKVDLLVAENKQGQSSAKGGIKTGVKKDAQSKIQEKLRVIQNQNRFLNEEIRRTSVIRRQEQDKFSYQERVIQDLEKSIEQWKRDYVYLLQSNVPLPLDFMSDRMEFRLYGGNKHKDRIKALLVQARQINPSLPSYERLADCETHVDNYGFRHTYESENLLLHYICQELHVHYADQLTSHTEHEQKWKEYLNEHRHSLKKTKELKKLCRGGIPQHNRAEVWAQLTYNHVRDIADEKGPHYFNNLCSMISDSQVASQNAKQISLDLLRTMPNNIQFRSSSCDGVKKLRNVLLAFCIHNPTIGYCQGFNFIVGLCLLLMSPEEAFWVLVAITEKHFSINYFDDNLIGALSDQELLRDLVDEKLPRLSDHLQQLDIDICTITLNWFLPIFFDAVPFHVLLRIWDCFLLEGPKVLFRISLALLKLYEPQVLCLADTISIMKHLKACARFTFDTEGLFKIAFEELKPFPSRKVISTKQACYINVLKENISKRDMIQRSVLERENMMESYTHHDEHVFDCGTVYAEGKLWICHSKENQSRVVKVSCGGNIMYDVNIQLDSRVTCACTLTDDMIILATLGGMLIAYSTRSSGELWQIRLSNSILSVCSITEDRAKVFAALADGTVAILENVYDQVDDCDEKIAKPDIYYIPVSKAPVSAMTIIQEQIWCACANVIYILHSGTLDHMDNFTISTNPYDQVLSMVYGEHGVWVAIKGSSIIELWDNKLLTCKLLYDVQGNRCPSFKKEDDSYFNHARVTSFLPHGNTVWIGTGEGTLLVYDVACVRSPHAKSRASTLDTSVGSSRNSSSPYLNSTGEPVRLEAEKVHDKVIELYFQRIKDLEVSSTEHQQDTVDFSVGDEEQFLKRRRSLSAVSEKSESPSTSTSTPSTVTSPVMSTKAAHSNSLVSSRLSNSSSSTMHDIGDASTVEISSCETKSVLDNVDDIATEDETDSVDIHVIAIGADTADCVITNHNDTAGNDTAGNDTADDAILNQSIYKEQDQVESYNKTNISKEKAELLCDKINCDNKLENATHNTTLQNDSQILEQKKDDVISATEYQCSTSMTVAKTNTVTDNGVCTCPGNEQLKNKTIFNKQTSSGSSTCISEYEDSHDKLAMSRSSLIWDHNLIGSAEFYSTKSLHTGKLQSDPESTGVRNGDANSLESHANSDLEHSSAVSVTDIPDITIEHGFTSSGNISTEGSNQEMKPFIHAMYGANKLATTGHLCRRVSCTSIVSMSSVEDGSTQSKRESMIESDALGEYLYSRRHLSKTPSSISLSGFCDSHYMTNLVLQAKLKISDKPVRCLFQSVCNGEPIIVSCSGCHGDDESVLKWRKEVNEMVWTNEPILEMCPVTNIVKHPSYTVSPGPRQGSEVHSTGSETKSTPIVNTTTQTTFKAKTVSRFPKLFS